MTYAPQTPPDVRTNGTSMPSSLSDAVRDSNIATAVQGIQSLQVAERVVDSLNLTHDAVLRKAAQKFDTRDDLRGAVATALLEGIKAKRIGETPLIDISYTSKDPLRSAKVTDAFGKAYEDQQTADNQALSQTTSGRMDTSTAQLAQQAHDADAAVARFKLEHHILFDPQSPEIGRDIAQITSSLADARAQSAEAQARAGFVRSGGINDQLVGNSPLSPLLAQGAEVSRNLATLQARYGARHPKVLEAQHELDDINAHIAQENRREANDAEAAARFASQRVKSLEDSLDTSRQHQIDQISAATQLQALLRQADTANTLYNNMLGNASQEAAKRAVMPPDTTVTSHATPPTQPSFPSLPLDLAVGFLLGFATGFAIAYVRERWSVGLTSNDEIERMLRQPFFNSLPTLDSALDKPTTRDPIAALVAHPLSLYTEAYRSLATNLRMSGTDVKVIAVTSALPKEGKTTTAINMARTVAMGGERVVLVDCDLRRRNVSTLLVPGATKGLVQVVRGEAQLEDVMHVDETGLHVLPLAPLSHIGSQPFGAAGFDALMVTLRQEYDVIVLDTAPVLAVVDVRLLLNHIDALGILARWRKTPIRAIRAAIHQIEAVGGQISGVALTLVDVNAQSHGSGDASHYYSEMKEYYDAA
jgi:capsular exopolysaccharide synthesis family protein